MILGPTFFNIFPLFNIWWKDRIVQDFHKKWIYEEPKDGHSGLEHTETNSREKLDQWSVRVKISTCEQETVSNFFKKMVFAVERDLAFILTLPQRCSDVTQDSWHFQKKSSITGTHGHALAPWSLAHYPCNALNLAIKFANLAKRITLNRKHFVVFSANLVAESHRSQLAV
jgi:hypothetical protein